MIKYCPDTIMEITSIYYRYLLRDFARIHPTSPGATFSTFGNATPTTIFSGGLQVEERFTLGTSSIECGGAAKNHLLELLIVCFRAQGF